MADAVAPTGAALLSASTIGWHVRSQWDRAFSDRLNRPASSVPMGPLFPRPMAGLRGPTGLLPARTGPMGRCLFTGPKRPRAQVRRRCRAMTAGSVRVFAQRSSTR